MVLVDGRGTPVGLHLDSASPAEVKLLQPTLESAPKLPETLVADKAYDSNPARRELVAQGIEPVIPARQNNAKATHQDGRRLRRYKNRWIVERTNAWLKNFRRLVARYERSDVTYLGLVHMAFALIVIRRILG